MAERKGSHSLQGSDLSFLLETLPSDCSSDTDTETVSYEPEPLDDSLTEAQAEENQCVIYTDQTANPARRCGVRTKRVKEMANNVKIVDSKMEKETRAFLQSMSKTQFEDCSDVDL